MTTHVFVVDATTFGVHLKYLFAGTGAREFAVDFNNACETDLNYSIENMLVGMSADASRVRRGDKILFYLQQNFSEGIREGKFYGVFEAVEDWSFLDDNDGNQYLLGGELNKSLTYRTLLRPDKVYAEGLTEWEALDTIQGMTSPNQMQWSLIYRKLKGNRGNTMITMYEAERLCQQLRNKNHRVELEVGQRQLTFDLQTQQVKVLESPRPAYVGRKVELNLLPRLITKYQNNRAFEAHLQSYIVKNIGLGLNASLDRAILGEAYEMEWLGNEMSCGVGMQRIDIAISIRQNGQRIFIPIELKAVEASLDNTRQVGRYLDWIEQYYIANYQSDIQPIVVAKKFDLRTATQQNKYEQVMNSFREFNHRNVERCKSIKYVEYYLNNEDLVFEEVSY